MKKLIWALVIVGSFTGCRRQTQWTKSGTSYQELQLQMYNCEKDAYKTVRDGPFRREILEVDKDMFARCMDVHGFVEAD
jgi:hypothetical protein